MRSRLKRSYHWEVPLFRGGCQYFFLNRNFTCSRCAGSIQRKILDKILARNPKYKSIYVIYEISCFYMRICEQTFSAGPSVYEFACPSVRPCVCPSVRPCVRPSVRAPGRRFLTFSSPNIDFSKMKENQKLPHLALRTASTDSY